MDFRAAKIGFPRGIRPSWIWAGGRFVRYIRQIVEKQGPEMTRFWDFRAANRAKIGFPRGKPRGMDWISARHGFV